MALPKEIVVFKGSPSGKPVKTSITSKSNLEPHEVAIRVTHSGICGTDEHYLQIDMVLGHEGVGTVEAVGSGVAEIKIGDRVGFGYVRDGCGHCSWCIQGRYYYCSQSRQFGVSDFNQGSWSNFAIWPETLIQRIPDDITSAEAAALMCAGITGFIPLMRNDVRPTDRVGIVGLGGLGHLATQFASKMGCEVVVFSSSERKRGEAVKLGATEFHPVKDLETSKPKGIDHLITTTAKHPDWRTFLNFMNPFGKVHLLAASSEDLVIPYTPVLTKELSFHGSCTYTPTEFSKMLEFAARHSIKPLVDQFPMTEEGISEALRKLGSGEIRYRGVVVVQ
ncbi:chaperonin 10-like protein [Lineolata rhizophorae]|uniref:Chaperonin 10-like protein n=1 Tax=Lineolata rhizophorae TaxID=578093 RepID=A0A6A6NM08_9PEZI|nr:chaperonin 10-like protein [Lineolata rhizophorae]